MKRKSLFFGIAGLIALMPVLSIAQVPRPFWATPGKEYTDNPDKNMFGAVELGRNLHWFGGGAVADSTRFDTEHNIDGTANIGDALFIDTWFDRSAMLISTRRDGRAPILYEMPGTGVNGIWATAADIDSNGVWDLDSLEVWGPDGIDDATHYSMDFDPGGVAVWEELGAVDLPWITSAEIAAAIGVPGMNVDLDALMLNGDLMIFSIRANGIFDGGEIWTYTRGGLPGSAAFLFHGGHLWDTAFDVMGTFGTATEDIDAIEAVDVVPEPASFAALGLGALALLRKRRKLA